MADSPFCMELRGKVRAVWGVWEKVVVISRGRSPLPEKGTAGSTKGRVSSNHQSILICCTDGHLSSTNQIGFSFHTCSPSALEGPETALASKRGAGAGLEKTLLSPPLAGGFLAGMWLRRARVWSEKLQLGLELEVLIFVSRNLSLSSRLSILLAYHCS